MGFSSKLGRARISARKPEAAGVCDRCGFVYSHSDLSWQFDYAGTGLINKRILVCRPCLDTPQNQLRSIALPADPVPIANPRIMNYEAAESSLRQTSGQNPGTRVTQDNNPRSTQQTGAPNGSRNHEPGTDMNAIMPLLEETHYGVTLPVISVVTDGVSTVTVTCSSVHSLSNNDLIAINGSGSTIMDGFYNVTVVSATVFSYQPFAPVPVPGPFDPALLQSETIFKTAYVGYPLGMVQIPQAGVVF